MNQLISSFGIFCGDPGHMCFTYNLEHFVNKRYYLAGQLVQWSIRHGGPGIPVISPIVYDIMAGMKPNVVDIFAELQHLPDADMKNNCKKVTV